MDPLLTSVRNASSATEYVFTVLAEDDGGVFPGRRGLRVRLNWERGAESIDLAVDDHTGLSWQISGVGL